MICAPAWTAEARTKMLRIHIVNDLKRAGDGEVTRVRGCGVFYGGSIRSPEEEPEIERKPVYFVLCILPAAVILCFPGGCVATSRDGISKEMLLEHGH